MAYEESPREPGTRIVPVKRGIQIGSLVIGKRLEEAEYAPRRQFTRFTAQRPVIYSGPMGFFENEQAQAFLTSVRHLAKAAIVPHATVMETELIQKVLDSRPQDSLMRISSDGRKFADALPARQFGHVKGAHAMGSDISLHFDAEGRRRLGSDESALRASFGIPPDPNERPFSPHMLIARAIDPEVAGALAEELNAIIKPTEKPSRMPIAFGDVTVLAGN